MTVWCVSAPVAWPIVPKWMSLSTLARLESCPKQWALSRADYKNIWDRRGYPGTPHATAIEGTVIHSAMERIVRSLSNNGCRSLNDEKAFFTLKKLGGFTAVINACIASALQSYDGNPRAVPFLGGVRHRLLSRAPIFRARIQQLLSRVRLEARAAIYMDDAPLVSTSQEELRYGTYSEVNLQVEEYHWRGVADMITLTPDTCEIRDFINPANRHMNFVTRHRRPCDA